MRPHQLKKFFRISIILICLAYLIKFFHGENENFRAILDIRASSIFLILLLGTIYLFIHCYRFKIILEKCSGILLPFWGWFTVFVQARFLTMVIPQFGNIYKGVALKSRFKISYTDYISAFTSFAWMDTCLNLTIATVIILLFAKNLLIGKYNAGMLLSIVTFSAISLPFVGRIILRNININHVKIVWLKSKLDEVLNNSLYNLRDMKYMSLIIFLGLVALVKTILIYHILFSSFGAEPDIYTLVVFYSLFKLSAFVVITPSNIGVQEIAFGFLSEQMGIGMAQGILVSVVGRILATILTIAFGITFGGIGLLQHRKDYSKNNLKQ